MAKQGVNKNQATGCSAVGSVRGLGPWGRGFEPLHPDQQIFIHRRQSQVKKTWAFSLVG